MSRTYKSRYDAFDFLEIILGVLAPLFAPHDRHRPRVPAAPVAPPESPAERTPGPTPEVAADEPVVVEAVAPAAAECGLGPVGALPPGPLFVRVKKGKLVRYAPAAYAGGDGRDYFIRRVRGKKVAYTRAFEDITDGRLQG